jgi:hypothetical protein
MSKKNKIVRSIHIANGTELTEHGILFLEQLKRESVNEIDGSEGWEPVGELVKNETPKIVCVGEMLRYPIDLTAFRWGCQITPTSKQEIRDNLLKGNWV